MVQTSYQFLVEYFGAGTSPGVGCFVVDSVVPFLHGISVALQSEGYSVFLLPTIPTMQASM